MEGAVGWEDHTDILDTLFSLNCINFIKLSRLYTTNDNGSRLLQLVN